MDTGVIVFIVDDGKRPRVHIAYPGEDGIKVGVWYKVVDGKIVESPDNDPAYLPWVDGAELAKKIDAEAGVDGKAVLVDIQKKAAKS